MFDSLYILYTTAGSSERDTEPSAVKYALYCALINPRRACARVTVVVLCVCVCISLFTL